MNISTSMHEWTHRTGIDRGTNIGLVSRGGQVVSARVGLSNPGDAT